MQTITMVEETINNISLSSLAVKDKDSNTKEDRCYRQETIL